MRAVVLLSEPYEHEKDGFVMFFLVIGGVLCCAVEWVDVSLSDGIGNKEIS